MRRILIILALALALSTPALAGVSQQPKSLPRLEDVLTYIDLFGYREMMELSVSHQLAGIINNVRTEHQEVPPDSLDIIQQELRRELKSATERSLRDMAKVFQKHLSQEDVNYLISVGRDPRMQKVVKLQPRLATELEKVGEGLAMDVYRRAAPRIEERLKLLQGGEKI